MTAQQPQRQHLNPNDNPNDAALAPAEMSARTGAMVDTLRYYEREGLLRNVARASSGHRRYSETDVLWVQVLRCLRDTGMSIEQLRHYADLGEQGPGTEPELREMLLAHRAEVERKRAELDHALSLIDHKLTFYQERTP